MMQSRVKGWQTLVERDNETSVISVSDDGRRMAAIEGSEADIKIYTLGESKTFLTEVEANSVAVAPDGRWIAIARPVPVARNGIAAAKETPIDIVWLDDAFPGTRGGGTREHRVPGQVTALMATPSTLLIMSRPRPKASQQLIGLDAKTGRTWAREVGRAPGRDDLIGRAKGIVRIYVGEKRRATFLRVSDGDIILETQPDDRVEVSSGHGAILVCRVRSDVKGRCDVEVYSIDGSRLILRGTMRELPRNRRLAVSEDGEYVLVHQDSFVSFVWQTRESHAAEGAKPVWSSVEHLDAGSRLSQTPRMLDGRHLWVGHQTAGGEQRAAIYRLGQSGHSPVLVWSAQSKAGDDFQIDMSQTKLLDNDRLFITRRTGSSRRIEIHRLAPRHGASPNDVYDNPVLISPRGSHIVWRGADKLAPSNRLLVTRLGLKEPLVRFSPAGNPPASFSPDDRWMATVPERKNVELFDLAAGRRFAGLEGIEESEWLDANDVSFVVGNRVAQIQLSNNATVLVPLHPALLKRFARSLVGERDLTPDERCAYLPERSGCTATSSTPVRRQLRPDESPKAAR
jgi:hypothetical protein